MCPRAVSELAGGGPVAAGGRCVRLVGHGVYDRPKLVTPDQPAQPGTPAPDDPLDPANLKRAMKAFRKRLKLTRLNEESKLGRNPLTSGKQSQVVAIMPPHQYPPEVWGELVRQGKLKEAGKGFYELAG